ncbi:MarR family winged helix-turn-helix transcriptional regulator [Ruania halotolerans]|uniref:MarR family winged helix-turn-helix transcriptional regulator n=1 Tax=Ruania halotolerans TaxID=2897773 RepID=UPI001E351D51|nr:MarR family transcriptional regulator [Ruania halotolerans]UFU05622.1 MarR family transcriptional regulator [Ruania halotolerans]
MPHSTPPADAPEPAPGPGVAESPDQWPTGRLLSAAARRVERAWDAYLAQWSLSHASVPVLAILAGGGRSQREIAEHTGVTEQTMSRMILGLERTGYVQRTPHPDDRRRHIVEITREGFAALSSLNVADAIEGLVPHDLDVSELAELRRLLIRFLD